VSDRAVFAVSESYGFGSKERQHIPHHPTEAFGVVKFRLGEFEFHCRRFLT